MSRPSATSQIDFLAPKSRLPAGLRYADAFLSADEEAALLERFAELPFANAQYKSYTANRRTVSYGGRYDFDRNVLADDARWQWQHAISPAKALRYSITFRTARLRPASGTSASTSAPTTTG